MKQPKSRMLAAMCIDSAPSTSGHTVRTTIDIDDALLAQAIGASGLATKKATVEAKAVADMAGLGWEGDRDTMRLDRMRKPRR